MVQIAPTLMRFDVGRWPWLPNPGVVLVPNPSQRSRSNESTISGLRHLRPVSGDAGRRNGAGLPTSFDDPREQIVYELTTTLIAPRTVPLALFRRARELLGDAGIVDLAILLGWYTGVAFSLAAYDVPAMADSTCLPQ